MRECDELLHRLGDEAARPEQPGAPAVHDTRLHLVFVPGMFNDCASFVALPFETSVPRLRSLGYQAEILPVSGRSSSAFNAARIAEFVSGLAATDERLVLVGHSKGAVDILEFMVAYPDLTPRVSAVVSVAGAINGSPLADEANDLYQRLIKETSLPGCPAGDGGALSSLQPAQRLNWLITHPLPQSTMYFSLVAFTRADSLTSPLRPFAAALAEIDAIGVQVKDLDTGLLDFPCHMDGETVLLCWRMGEPRIDFWHSVEDGFRGRQPIDERFRRMRPEKLN